MKRLLFVSLVANAVLGCLFWSVQTDYSSLLTWACDNASLGGYECGEQ